MSNTVANKESKENQNIPSCNKDEQSKPDKVEVCNFKLPKILWNNVQLDLYRYINCNVELSSYIYN